MNANYVIVLEFAFFKKKVYETEHFLLQSVQIK